MPISFCRHLPLNFIFYRILINFNTKIKKPSANYQNFSMNTSQHVRVAFSHIGFHVTDLEGVARFYKEVLQFTETDRGDLGTVQLLFLSRDPDTHHQIALVSGRPPTGLPFNPINQISFQVPDLLDLRKVHERALEAGASDMQASTHGNAISLYFRDPEGNRLEVFMNTPWYCIQPLREPIDFTRSDEAVMQQAEHIARNSKHYMPRSEWRSQMVTRMARDQGIAESQFGV